MQLVLLLYNATERYDRRCSPSIKTQILCASHYSEVCRKIKFIETEKKKEWGMAVGEEEIREFVTGSTNMNTKKNSRDTDLLKKYLSLLL